MALNHIKPVSGTGFPEFPPSNFQVPYFQNFRKYFHSASGIGHVWNCLLPLSSMMEVEVQNSPNTAKKRSVRSWVWEYFTVNSENGHEASCVRCAGKVSASNGTNKLKHHLSSVHQIFKPEVSISSPKPINKRMRVDNHDQTIFNTKLYVLLSNYYYPLD